VVVVVVTVKLIVVPAGTAFFTSSERVTWLGDVKLATVVSSFLPPGPAPGMDTDTAMAMFGSEDAEGKLGGVAICKELEFLGIPTAVVVVKGPVVTVSVPVLVVGGTGSTQQSLVRPVVLSNLKVLLPYSMPQTLTVAMPTAAKLALLPPPPLKPVTLGKRTT
jgi:hypothetical protein